MGEEQEFAGCLQDWVMEQGGTELNYWLGIEVHNGIEHVAADGE